MFNCFLLQLISQSIVKSNFLTYVWFLESAKKKKSQKNDFLILGFTIKNEKKKKSNITRIIKKFCIFLKYLKFIQNSEISEKNLK